MSPSKIKSPKAAEAVDQVNARTPQIAEGEDEWLTMREVSERVKVPYSRVRRWVYAGVLPSHVLPGGRGRRVKASDLVKAMGAPVEGKSYVH